MPEQHKRGILADRWKTIHKQQRPAHVPSELAKIQWIPTVLRAGRQRMTQHWLPVFRRTPFSLPLDPVPSCPSLLLPCCISYYSHPHTTFSTISALPQPAFPHPIHCIHALGGLWSFDCLAINPEAVCANDLLPVYYPSYFPYGARQNHDRFPLRHVMLHCLLPGGSSTLALIWTPHSPVIFARKPSILPSAPVSLDRSH